MKAPSVFDFDQSAITIGRLLARFQDRLGLQWLVGEEWLKNQAFCPESNKNLSVFWVGYLNPLRPHCIQVLGQLEIDYLTELKTDIRENFWLERHQITAFSILAGVDNLPTGLLDFSRKHQIGLLKTGLSGHEILNSLQYYLNDFLAPKTSVHGVFMEILGIGVLITGESGVGKSELALELLSRGHRLVADDCVEFTKFSPDRLQGSCPRGLRNFLEVRGLGILNIRAMFGDNAIRLRKYLRLVLHLDPPSPDKKDPERLARSEGTETILGIDIPRIFLPMATGRNLAVLSEVAVRDFILRMNGYDANEEFIAAYDRSLL